MAATVEWRQKNSAHLHTGSAEVVNGSGKPILYAHPRDQAGPVYSPAADWSYTQEDATTDPVSGKDIDITVMGFVSYETYRDLFNRWQNAGMIAHALARLLAGVSRQTSPADVFGKPLASALQPSGELIYEAYLKLTPPEPVAKKLDISVAMTVEAMTPVMPPSVGTGGTIANVSAFNETGEIAHIRALGQFGQSLDTDSKTVDYTVTVEPGQEIKVASADAGLAFTISKGNAYFTATASAKVTV